MGFDPFKDVAKVHRKTTDYITDWNRDEERMWRSTDRLNRAKDQAHRSGARENYSTMAYVNSEDNLQAFFSDRAAARSGGQPQYDYAPQGYSSVSGSYPGAMRGTYNYGSSNGYAQPQGRQQGGKPQGVAMAESVTLPLQRAMNTTGAERDAALDEVIASINRLGPNTALPRPPKGGYYQFSYDTQHDFVVKFDPNKPLTPEALLQGSIAEYERKGGDPALEDALRARISGGAAPQTPSQQTPATQTPAQQAQTQQAPTGTAAPAPTTSQTAPAPVTTASVPSGNGTKAHAFNEKFPALPADANQIMAIQQNLIAAGFEVGPVAGQADGKSGRRTYTAFETICTQAGIDPKKVDFRNPNDPETKLFNDAIGKRIAERAAPKQTAPQGPSAEELAAAEAARAAQAKAQADARELPELLNTPFDSRNIARMNEGQRYALARETLLGIGELKYEKKQHDFENLHDKLKEAVRDANKIMGENVFREPRDQNHPFTDDAMAALGVVAAKEARKDAKEGHLNPMAAALAQAREEGAINTTVSGGVEMAEASASSARGASGPQVKGR